MRASSSLLIDLLICLRFLTRIPFPALAAETAPQSLSGFSRALRMVPAAGALLGALSAGALVSASALGLPPLLAAPLAIAVLAALSGAMHEDGLADCADGFGGGATRERKLEIMADSRIGAFGAVALALALYIRIAAVASIAAHSLALAVTALIGAAAVSRAAALIPLAVLPPARTKGAGFSAGRPQSSALAVAAALAALFAGAPLIAGADPSKSALAFAACAGAGFAFSDLARRQIGGQTGDVAGATQQISEALFYLIFAATF
ncbi:adenosylcobinamide-GDP ribazoletransferase [Methylocella tundrae]|uniref:adenosylcobinamide-GDP ribazoletransferase n=1 Tax=Methylocella tundrae TaxID=227605 RepID=UPI0030FE57C1|nr:adenosylcobinamide-GDP ribazoletransferase [Methylocella tundrae]